MKVLLIIFIFYVHNVISDDGEIPAKKFPKKVPGQILINYGKYAKPIASKLVTKAEGKDTKYTFFQSVNEPKNTQNIPESLYFPAEPVVIQKIRVKKVLPDYVWSSLVRSKREADTSSLKSDNITSNVAIVNQSLDEAKIPIAQNNETRRLDAKPQSAAVKAVDTKNFKNAQPKPAVARSVKKVRKGTKIARKNPAKESQKRTGNKGKTAQKKVNRKLTKTNILRTSAKTKTKSKGKSVSKKGSAGKKLKPGLRPKKSKSKVRQKPKNLSLRVNKAKKQTNVRKVAKKQGIKKRRVANKKMPGETRRLTAAREASIEDYPYVVSIQKNDEHWCSGALLNPRLVITTANCVWKSNHISRMEIRAGSSFTDRGGQVASIQEMMKHPRWGLRKNPDNDVALLLLDRFIKFSHSCHAVDLPNRAMFPAFDDAWVASWGSERRDGVFEAVANNLQVYHSQVISHELCNNITTRFGVVVTDNFICLSQSGRTSPCTRDTGAPAVSDGILWGIASWGLRKLCGTERYPSMFSYIASQSNMDFIMNATSYLMSDFRVPPFPDRPINK